MQIRDIRNEDAQNYRRLREKIDGESNTWGADPGERYKSDGEVVELIESVECEPHSRILVVEEDQRLVGFLSAITGKWRRSKHYVNIEIGLLASHCGRGIGQILFWELETWARTQGIRKFELYVREDNVKARRLYKKMGFEEEGLRRESLQVGGVYFNQVWMAKFLTTDAN